MCVNKVTLYRFILDLWVKRGHQSPQQGVWLPRGGATGGVGEWPSSSACMEGPRCYLFKFCFSVVFVLYVIGHCSELSLTSSFTTTNRSLASQQLCWRPTPPHWPPCSRSGGERSVGLQNSFHPTFLQVFNVHRVHHHLCTSASHLHLESVSWPTAWNIWLIYLVSLCYKASEVLRGFITAARTQQVPLDRFHYILIEKKKNNLLLITSYSHKNNPPLNRQQREPEYPTPATQTSGTSGTASTAGPMPLNAPEPPASSHALRFSGAGDKHNKIHQNVCSLTQQSLINVTFRNSWALKPAGEMNPFNPCFPLTKPSLLFWSHHPPACGRSGLSVDRERPVFGTLFETCFWQRKQFYNMNFVKYRWHLDTDWKLQETKPHTCVYRKATAPLGQTIFTV